MTPVKVHDPLPATVTLSDLSALLTAAGLSSSSPLDWEANCPDGSEVSVLLVVAIIDPLTESSLANAVQTAISQKERVIAVWPLGAEHSPVSPVLEDYGAALVAWDPAALHSAICGKAEWQDIAGDVRPERPLDRNKC